MSDVPDPSSADADVTTVPQKNTGMKNKDMFKKDWGITFIDFDDISPGFEIENKNELKLMGICTTDREINAKDLEPLNMMITSSKETAKKSKSVIPTLYVPSDEMIFDHFITSVRGPALPLFDCTGCFACQNVCPVDAVVFENKNGFFKPFVDVTKCIGCGKCTSHCHLLSDQTNNTTQKCYAAMASDDLRMKSSSGGAFTLLAEEIISKGGVVWGAAYTSSFEVEHFCASTLEELEKLRGSKYMQSRIGNAYKKIEQSLKTDVPVLFTGTPCQVAGLKSYLNKEYDELYTIDLICHGISSGTVFKEYIRDCHSDKTISKIGFKEKKPWGWRPGMNISFEDGSAYQRIADRDPFFRAYLSGMSQNPSCSKCRYPKLNRPGDLTIGDFWGIQKYDPKLNDDRGTSIVLTNSKKGKKLLKSVSTFKKIEEVPIEHAVDGNRSLSASVPLHPRSARFFRGLGKIGFDKLIRDCFENRYDVGILLTEDNIDYEDSFEIYSFYSYVTSLGYSCAVIYRPECNISAFLKDYVNLEKYGNNFPDILFIFGSFENLNDYLKGLLKRDAKTVIPFSTPLFRKMSNEHATEKNLRGFDHRSFDSKYTLKKNSETEAGDVAVVNPLFLTKKEEYYELSEKETLYTPYIFSYFKKIDNKIQAEIKKKNCKNLPIVNFASRKHETACIANSEIPVQLNADERVWLNSLLHSEKVFTDSYGVVCIAILAGKPFEVIINENIEDHYLITEILSEQGLLGNVSHEMVSLELDTSAIDNTKKWITDSITQHHLTKLKYGHQYDINFGTNNSLADLLRQRLETDPNRVIDFCHNLCDLEFHDAYGILGCTFVEGITVEKDITKAKELIKMAAKYNPKWWREFSRYREEFSP
jgi:Coenzyme F420-reducing hydrogenase, beta subunit